ncbi:hypothetical protein [Herbaspirillum frisingense]|uniref:hypothetical protein n=1 Tax=Herbaspirillum frisingense TaxID=92645 RepID=UPI0039AF908A
MPTYTSLAVFLLSAISLVIASGFSLGAGMLVLGATVLLRPASPRLRLAAPDYLFIAALGFYFLLHVALNLIHHAPGREYDAPLRFLLAIPALLLLCTFPPRCVMYQVQGHMQQEIEAQGGDEQVIRSCQAEAGRGGPQQYRRTQHQHPRTQGKTACDDQRNCRQQEDSQ